MPVADEVRGYADAAVNQGKTALTQVGTLVQSVTGALGSLIEDSAPPSHLALGVADLAAEAVSRRAEAATKRVDGLPADYTRVRSGVTLAHARTRLSHPVNRRARLPATRLGAVRLPSVGGSGARLARARLTQRQEDAVAAIAKAQEGAQATISGARARIKDRPTRAAVQNSLGRARDVYSTLNDRGEKRAAELATDERLARLIADFDAASESIQSRVLPMLDAFSSRLDDLMSHLSTADAPPLVPAASEPAVRKSAVPEPAAPTSAVPEPAAPKSAVPEPAVPKPAVPNAAVLKPAGSKPAASKKAPSKKAPSGVPKASSKKPQPPMSG